MTAGNIRPQLSPAGTPPTVVWIHQIEDLADDVALGVATDEAGNPYVTVYTDTKSGFFLTMATSTVFCGKILLGGPKGTVTEF